MTFESLRLAAPILRAIGDEGYTTPTPIQAQAIPHIIAGGDLLGCAQTGTGKTGAFAMPILHRLSQTEGRSRLRCLVLCPTRELAAQITDSFNTYGKYLKLRHTAVFGGVGQMQQVRAIKRGVDILIATPGRLMDLMGQGHIDLRTIETLILDEADQMLDMGFLPDIRKITAKLPSNRQTLMFSATMPPEIRALAGSLLTDPINVEVTPVASTVQTITQRVYHVPAKSKQELLTHLLLNEAMQRTLVFTRTKHGADRVVKHLLRAGVRAEAIHGNKSQNARMKALASFKGKKPPVLVATDIASRGIDVDQVTHVVNFDIPSTPEAYVHRIGRTARAGASGVAMSFCSPDETRLLRAIERLTKQRIEASSTPELTTFASQPQEVAKVQDEAPARLSKPRSQRAASPQRRPRKKGTQAEHAHTPAKRNNRKRRRPESGEAVSEHRSAGTGGRHGNNRNNDRQRRRQGSAGSGMKMKSTARKR